jgi:membrane-bound lytic murein transglycosylase B
MKTQRPEPPGALLRYYKKAQRRFDVDWEVLAAVNSIETRFGRIRSASYAGAQGPMQFIPSTWRAYGMGGDVHDPHDAILGAANYLSASGAPRDYRRALYAYNNANEYVTAVIAYAREIMRRARNYYVYYSWQVFVRTTKGDMQLTGPGKDRR